MYITVAEDVSRSDMKDVGDGFLEVGKLCEASPMR
jgi:hypothetical protein